jgi:hypothetical protein
MRKDWHKDYYQKNRERIIKKVLEWRKENPERWKEIQKRYRERNREKWIALRKKYFRKYYQKHRKEILAKREKRNKELEKIFWQEFKRKIKKLEKVASQGSGKNPLLKRN